jgi:hypothetical protein
MEYGKLAIFTNFKKKKGDPQCEKWPDFNGKITITEAIQPGEYEVSIYNSTSKGGLDYKSGKIKDAWKPTARPREEAQPKEAVIKEEFDESFESDQIPF